MKLSNKLAAIGASALLVIGMAACGGSAQADPVATTTPAPSASTGGAYAAPQVTQSQFVAPTPPPTDSNIQLDRVQGAVESNNVAGGYDVNATQEYITAMIQHGDTIWTNWFKANGLQEPWVGYNIIMPGQTAPSTCFAAPLPSNHPNAYFCPTDSNGTDYGMLYFPVETIAKMWSGNILERPVPDPAWVGDFAAAVIVAHENGHNIQNELAEQYGKPNPHKPNDELIADCFAGVWTYALYLDQRLETGDIDEAINALRAIGDYDDTGGHGKADKREDAFRTGLYGTTDNLVPGLPWNCTSKYWPELYQ